MPKKLLLCAAIFFLVLSASRGAEAADSFPAFSAKNLDGQTVTNAIFADKKLTMINFWATWCPPCVKEMPDLGKLGRSMPEETQLVGILLDVEKVQRAKDILSKAQADFFQICYDKDMYSFRKTIKFIPTTIFVDSQGQIVGNPITGARSEKAYREELEKRLERVNRRLELESALDEVLSD